MAMLAGSAKTAAAALLATLLVPGARAQQPPVPASGGAPGEGDDNDDTDGLDPPSSPSNGPTTHIIAEDPSLQDSDPAQPPSPASPADVELGHIDGAKSCEPLRISWQYTAPNDGHRVSLRVSSASALSKRSIHRLEKRRPSQVGGVPVSRRDINNTISPPEGVVLSDGSFLWQQVSLPAGSYQISLDAPAQDGDDPIHAVSDPFKVDPGTSTSCLPLASGSSPSASSAPSGQPKPPINRNATSDPSSHNVDAANGGDGGGTSSGTIAAAVVVPVLFLVGVLLVLRFIQRRRRRQTMMGAAARPAAPRNPFAGDTELKHSAPQTRASSLDSFTTAGEHDRPRDSQQAFGLSHKVDQQTEATTTVEFLASSNFSADSPSPETADGGNLSRSASNASTFSIKRKPVPPLALQRSATVQHKSRNAGLANRPAQRLSEPSMVERPGFHSTVLRLNDGGIKDANHSNRDSALPSSTFDHVPPQFRSSEALPLDIPSALGVTAPEHRASAATIQVTWHPGQPTCAHSRDDTGPVSAAPTVSSFSGDRSGCRDSTRTEDGTIAEEASQTAASSRHLSVHASLASPGRRGTSDTAHSSRTLSMSESLYAPCEVLVATRVNAVPVGTEPVSLSSLSSLTGQPARGSEHGEQGEDDGSSSDTVDVARGAHDDQAEQRP
ncbi:uncharacterized protein PSFLO_01988 [Pseudozyma flocculosa]|nr:uncharacterized protein PSFLO_01988 [Pseudozyma flocculosa]